MNFDEIIGNYKIKDQIVKSIKIKDFSHAHIIVGEDGIGKSIIARETAAYILGKNSDNQCVDIVECRITGNKKSIGIDEIKVIIEEVNKKPYEGDKKVIIIYSADKITEVAQNALLKTIEEPPNGIYLILLCEKLDSILDTIQSRCETYKLNRLKDEDIVLFLNRNFPNLPEEERKSVIAFSDGIPGRAERFIKDSSFHEIRDVTAQILLELQEEGIEFISKYSLFLFKHKDEWQEILTCILSYIRDALIYKETGNKNFLINNDKFNDIKNMCEIFSFNKFNGIINIIKRTRMKLEDNVSPSLVFDSMLVNMQEV
ncbi:DNA polymerase III subunit delta' [Clostridium tyrobutyricum]|uniref:DNA polymerase III subunit delta' n=1 Tax=Clostridium tyrobutyricum TaxID=1519 RepID=UPI001C38262A|nr:DNA polymerase III subunit delta' [Clostridium tyrobutyricum]MBV4418843.1 DNA polymerase III subunit delta' [Clostridium tyrobutyricum]